MMPKECEHINVTNRSEAYGEWSWVKRPDGRGYDVVGQFEIDHENNISFQCDDCGEFLNESDIETDEEAQ